MSRIIGIHSVASATGDPEATRAFYGDMLGMALGPERAGHIDFRLVGDGASGHLAFQILAPAPLTERDVTEANGVVLSIAPGSFAAWRQRLDQFGAEVLGHAWAFGSEYLCFSDPNGLELALVEDPLPRGARVTELKVFRLKSLELQVGAFTQRCEALIAALGLLPSGHEQMVHRYRSSSRSPEVAIDLFLRPDRLARRFGPGMLHSFSWTVSGANLLDAIVVQLQASGFTVRRPYSGCVMVDTISDFGFEIGLSLGEAEVRETN